MCCVIITVIIIIIIIVLVVVKPWTLHPAEPLMRVRADWALLCLPSVLHSRVAVAIAVLLTDLFAGALWSGDALQGLCERLR